MNAFGLWPVARTIALMEHPLRRPELLACAWRGHVTPGADIPVIQDHHDVVARATIDGRRVVQCLRCASWIIADSPTATSSLEPQLTQQRLAPPRTGRRGAGSVSAEIRATDPAHRPRRGAALREAIIMRFIAIDRGIHAVLYVAVGAAALVAEWNIAGLHDWANTLLTALKSAKRGDGGASSHGMVSGLLTRLGEIKATSLGWIAAFAFAYALVSAFETVGLWKERRWAEYLTALATAGFLPLEVHEIINKITIVRVGALLINLVILGYLVHSKHLFGFRGPIVHHEPEPLTTLPDLAPRSPVAG